MNVNGRYYTAVWIEDTDPKTVKIINQLCLPFRFEIKELRTVVEAYHSIVRMEVRGAPLIGIVAAYSIYLACLESAKKDNSDEYISQSAEYIKSSRPTAVNLFYSVDRMTCEVLKRKNIQEKIETARVLADTIRNETISSCKKIGEYGVELIRQISNRKKGELVNILTHCNAGWLACGDYGTATSPIYLAHDTGIKVHVWVDETRPRNQGARLTAWELKAHGVPYTLIPDNTGGLLMQKKMVDIVITGSDRTTKTGDTANKIGTYLKALAAKADNVPFWVALPSSSIDWNISDGLKEIQIEERNGNEVKYIEGLIDGRIDNILIAPEDAPVKNYGFDITPSALITGFITERGICDSDKLLNMFPEKQII